MLVGKLFVTLLPFGNIAYRVNVMSAFFAAGAVALLFKLVRRYFEADCLTAFAVTLLFAASPAVVALSRVAEMYTSSACLAAAILYCLFSNHPRGTSYAALLLGLGLSVHPTLIFLSPLFLISPARSVSRSSGLFFLLGLIRLPLPPCRFASQHPVVELGRSLPNWRNFWRVVTRAPIMGD